MASKRLFIGNLPLNTIEETLTNEFSSYGNIETVEIKTKTNAFDEETCFAFISMQIDDRTLQQCIREFKEQKFNGNYLSVSLAKESFLDRLKREREGGHGNDADSKRIKVQTKHDFTANLNPKRQPQRDYTHQSYDNEDEHFEQPADSNTDGQEQQQHNKISESDRKRVESVKKLADLNKQKKNLIKSALSNIDNAKNKIVFDDGDSQWPSTNISKSRKTSNPTLFDNDEGEDYNQDFKIKEQFQGVKGQKLLELQTRYKSDHRFQLDERFKADYDDYDEEQQNGANIEENGYNEREEQLKILENIVGKPLSRDNTNINNPNQMKKSIMMTRFDPTKNVQQNLTNRLPGRKAATTELSGEAGEPIVSQETFYKVSDNLKSALKSNETTNGFSLLGMFGKVDDEDNDDRETINSYQIIDTNKKKKHKEKNPFKYDSSESEDEVDFKKADKMDKTNKSELYRETFFYVDDDQRLIDGAQFYRMVESTENSNFDEYRGELKKVVRKKFKKYQEKAGERGGRRMNSFRRKAK